jgi:phosphomannomutase
MIDTLARKHNLPVFETPVGFKYLGQVMMEEDAILAGEESGGYGFKGHIPERDGILSGLMILDMMTKTGKNPSELISDLESEVGPHHYDRQDIELAQLNRAQIEETLKTKKPRSIANLSVTEVDERDGFKYFLEDGSWCLIRFSGTEPLIRLYAESNTRDQVELLIKDCRLILGI